MIRKALSLASAILILVGPILPSHFASGQSGLPKVPVTTVPPDPPEFPWEIDDASPPSPHRPHPSPPRRRFPSLDANAPQGTTSDGHWGTDLRASAGAGAAVGYRAMHQVHETLELPLPAVGNVTTFYGPTGTNANSCFEISTAYNRYSGEATTRREVQVWDLCTNPNPTLRGSSIRPIDNAFVTTYVTLFNGRRVYWTTLSQSGKPDGKKRITYEALLWNPNTNRWERIDSMPSTKLPNPEIGWSIHENYFRTAGLSTCPWLPPIAADEIKVKIGNTWFYADPDKSGVRGIGWCYFEAPAGSQPYIFTMINPNRMWEVKSPPASQEKLGNAFSVTPLITYKWQWNGTNRCTNKGTLGNPNDDVYLNQWKLVSETEPDEDINPGDPANRELFDAVGTWKNHGFTIPLGATVAGVEVVASASIAQVSNGFYIHNYSQGPAPEYLCVAPADFSFQTPGAGNISLRIGPSGGASSWKTLQNGTVTYGSPTDRWGFPQEQLTPANVNHAEFGVDIVVVATSFSPDSIFVYSVNTDSDPGGRGLWADNVDAPPAKPMNVQTAINVSTIRVHYR